MAYNGPVAHRINWDEFDKLVSFQCTQIEVAAFFDVSVDTLDRECRKHRGASLAEVWDKRKLLGKVRLRKAQFSIVESGGPGAATMAIWLDKKINPDENPDKITPPLMPINAIPAEGLLSFSDFCAKAGYHRPFPKQEEMRAFGLDETVPRLLLGARSYGKTDYLTIMGAAYKVYLDHNYKILIVTKSKSRNTALINEIADALEANGVNLNVRNSSCIKIEGASGKDFTVEAITIKSSFRGRHPDLLIFDDPVTEEDVSSAMRELVKRKYDEGYKLCKNLLVIGQPAHSFDLYAELRPLLKKMEVAWGNIPELDADLEAMKLAGVSESSIEMSYHLRIPEAGQTPFAGIKYIDHLPAGDSVAFIDPSDGGDFTAMSILKGYLEGIAVKGFAKQVAWYLCIDEMIKLMIQHGVKKVCFETNATGTQPLIQLRQLLAPHGIVVVGVHSDTNKEAAIMSAGSFAHMIHLSKDSSSDYTKQVTQYDHSAKYDDSPDSLARGLIWLGLIRGKKRGTHG